MRRAAFVLVVAATVALLSADRAGATSWPEFRRDHHRVLHRGLVNPGIPTEAITADWLVARAEYVSTLRRRRDRLYHRFMEIRAAETSVVPAPLLGGGATEVLTWANADAVAECESGGNWAINNGNGFWGGLQFLPSTWFAWGGGPFDGVGPFPYSREEQISVAVGHSLSAWPVCGARV
jgi:hypothetical protein